MFLLLALGALCSVVASSGYGAPLVPPPTYGESNMGPLPIYEQYYYEDDYSREVIKKPKKEKKCKELKHFNFQVTSKTHVNRAPVFSTFERRGNLYVKISCPRDTNKYVLIAAMNGKWVGTGNFGSPTKVVDGSVLLTSGYMIDYVARCEGDEIMAIAYTKQEIEIEQVACVSYDVIKVDRPL